MKYLFLILSIYSISCRDARKESLTQQLIQRNLFDTTFNYDKIVSIDLVKIEHPMLGGIISTKTLTQTEKLKFIEILRDLIPAGIRKCGNKFVIRIILTNDTLRLKTCGEMISSRTKDYFYCLPDSGKIIGAFVK